MSPSGDPAVEGVDTDGIREYLETTEVVFAVLFGSRARGTGDESSDVDIALRFPDDMDARERFRSRNRIDATLQEYASAFVDVSDIEALPTSVAYAAVRDGHLLVGDPQAVAAARERLEAEHETTASEREEDRREFIDRLAQGDV